jgi:hypothetical protein
MYLGFSRRKYLSGLENPDICGWLVKERLETGAISHGEMLVSTPYE